MGRKKTKTGKGERGRQINVKHDFRVPCKTRESFEGENKEVSENGQLQERAKSGYLYHVCPEI